MNRKVIKLITKILPIIEYHVCISFVMSKEFYRDEKERQVGVE